MKRVRPIAQYIQVCYYCLEPIERTTLGNILDENKTAIIVFNSHPCKECSRKMDTGILLISTIDGEEELGYTHPTRSGKFVVVTDNFIRKYCSEEIASITLERRYLFVEDYVWNKLRLPGFKEEWES